MVKLMDHRQTMTKVLVTTIILATILATAIPASAQRLEFNPPPTAKDWSDLANLPDWSGVWIPDIADQTRQWKENKTPWTVKAAREIADMNAAEAAGKPVGIFNNCLPLGIPSWMLMSHSAMEFLFTPGRVTMLGELDGNRLRRVYTDGRLHPEDPDITFHGHSIGHWERDMLVIDTIGILPEVVVGVSEGA